MNLQKPDMIIGQPNGYTTLAGINGTAGSSGLSGPTGLLVDSKGNLYIADSGNNRIVRYPAPFAGSGSPTPDAILGQPDPFTSHSANQGLSAPTANTLSLSTSLPTALALDGASNHLYVTDGGNRRVLGYPLASLAPGTYGVAADIVLGQADFVSVEQPGGQSDRNHIYAPAGLAFDSARRLFVSDAGGSRIMVFGPGMATGSASVRIAGVVSPTPTTATQSTFLEPEGIVMLNNGPAVVDAGYHRILLFDPFTSPDWATSDPAFVKPPPVATGVIGQTGYTASYPNAGNAQPSASTFANPVAAAVAGTDLFVADSGNNRVLVFPNNGQGGSAVRVLGQSNFPYNGPDYVDGAGLWFGPNVFTSGSRASVNWDGGLAVDASSGTPHLYVSDPGNNRVLAFKDARKAGPGVPADLVIGQPDMNTSVCNFGGVHVQTPAPGQLTQQPTQSSLCYPTGLAIDPSGDLYVADSLNGRVVRFPAPFASGKTSGEQADLILGQSAFTGLKNPTVSAAFMGLPYGLVFDAANGLLVCDRSYNRVLLFSKNNLTSGASAVKVIGQPDFSSSGNAVLSAPYHIAEDSNARVYVADSGHRQVLIFGSLTNLTDATTISVNALTNLNNPQAVWVNPTSVDGYPDDIWVGDNSNGVLRYPRYSLLAAQNNQPIAEIPSAALGTSSCGSNTGVGCLPTLAITQDNAGNLYVADYSNRITLHYQAVATTNAANFVCAGGCALGTLNQETRSLSPGVIGSVFGFSATQFGPNSADFNNVLPVPTTVGDIQVLVNGAAAPIFHVTPSQINFVVPNKAPTSGFVPIRVVQKSTGYILGTGTVQMYPVSPGLFTSTQSGIGQVAALNQDNSKNSSSNPAARGSVIQLFGTGQGLVPGGPADGELPNGTLNTPSKPQILLNGIQVPNANVQFSGLAPCCVGLWQINVLIPDSTAPSSVTPTSIIVNYQNVKNFIDNQHITTISVK